MKEGIHKHQLREEKQGNDSSCAKGLLYTVDENTSSALKEATGAALPRYHEPKNYQQE